MSAEPTTSTCALCGNPVDPHAPSTWKRVRGWVGGPRKDSMRLREDTDEYAHDDCVQAVSKGQAPGQPDLFDDTLPVVRRSPLVSELIEPDEDEPTDIPADDGNEVLAENPSLEWRG